jgi:hypothetical protein
VEILFRGENFVLRDVCFLSVIAAVEKTLVISAAALLIVAALVVVRLGPPACVGSVAREMAVAAFDVVITLLLFHPLDEFFIGTTVGMRVVAISTVIAAFAASASTSANSTLEVLLILVGIIGLFAAVDRICLALLILAFPRITSFDSRVQIG